MKFSAVKTVVCNSLFLAEAVALFFLLCGAVQGSVGLLAALGYGALSFFAVNLLAACVTALPAPRFGRRACRRTARPRVALRVVPGGEHAA